jgi:stress response protein YsnF
MTRSEEQLRVHTEQVAATRVRLVKYVVTEEVQVTVPLRREEIRLEEVPLDAPEPDPGEFLVPDEPHRHGHDDGHHDAGHDAGGRPAGADGLPEEIVLHSERPVVTVEVVPTERVRLRTEQVTGQEQVTDRVQRERIAVDEPIRTQRKNV